jgi:hypothetical protein
LDAADARRFEEEERMKAEVAKFEAEHKEKVRRREQDMLKIAAAEHELQAWKKALHITNKTANNDNNDYSDSAVDGPPVCLIFSASFSFILIVTYIYLED